MRIGYRFSDEGDRIHVYSSSLKNTELLSFDQEWFTTHSKVQLTDSVDYPNILATDVFHPDTEQPLFYVMKLPLFSYTKEKDIRSAVKMVKGGEEVDDKQYYVTHDTSNILLYTNLRNTNRPYEVIYAPYPDSTLSRSSRLLLSVEPALTLNDDYTISYNGNYRLSQELYVKPDPDKTGVLTHLYTADATVPWYVFINNITTKMLQILPTSRTITIELPARRLEKNLYKVDARDVHSVQCDGINVLSCSNDGFVRMKTNDYVVTTSVNIKTKRNIVTSNYLPYDFRPTINNFNEYKLTAI